MPFVCRATVGRPLAEGRELFYGETKKETTSIYGSWYFQIYSCYGGGCSQEEHVSSYFQWSSRWQSQLGLPCSDADKPDLPTEKVATSTDLVSNCASKSVQIADLKFSPPCSQSCTELKLHTSTVVGQVSDVDTIVKALKGTARKTQEPKSAQANETAQPLRRKWSSLLKESSSFKEIGAPTQHISGVPFVLIPDDKIESAKAEFEDFVFAQFHGPPPEMGRVIGVVKAIWASKLGMEPFFCVSQTEEQRKLFLVAISGTLSDIQCLLLRGHRISTQSNQQ